MFPLTGTDLNMAYERARVTVDDAPSSPVTHRVIPHSHVTSLHGYVTPLTLMPSVPLYYSLSYVFLCSPIWRRVWRCCTLLLKCFTTQTMGGIVTPSSSVRAAQSYRRQRKTYWESSSCRWEAIKAVYVLYAAHMKCVTLCNMQYTSVKLCVFMMFEQ